MASGDVLPRFYTVFLSCVSSNSLKLIPRSYYEHLPRRLPKTAILTGTGGRVWKVAMMSKREQVYLARGWENFVADNELKDGEFLTFVFDGYKSYEVSIYGRGSCKETRAVVHVEEISDESESDNDSLGSLVDVTPMPAEENSDDTEGDNDSCDSVVDVTPMPVEEISDASDSDYY
ncbi:hypothetical protein [Arabidopsis thaliana]|nr:hypothetical protein [Arabidopsis thaliana]